MAIYRTFRYTLEALPRARFIGLSTIKTLGMTIMGLFISKRTVLGFATSTLLAITSTGLVAQEQDLATLNAELDVLKTSVSEREASLDEKKTQLEAQSQLLQCLGERLEGYSTCEQQQAADQSVDTLAACLANVNLLLGNCESDSLDNTMEEATDDIMSDAMSDSELDDIFSAEAESLDPSS